MRMREGVNTPASLLPFSLRTGGFYWRNQWTARGLVIPSFAVCGYQPPGGIEQGRE